MLGLATRRGDVLINAVMCMSREGRKPYTEATCCGVHRWKCPEYTSPQTQNLHRGLGGGVTAWWGQAFLCCDKNIWNQTEVAVTQYSMYHVPELSTVK